MSCKFSVRLLKIRCEEQHKSDVHILVIPQLCACQVFEFFDFDKAMHKHCKHIISPWMARQVKKIKIKSVKERCSVFGVIRIVLVHFFLLLFISKCLKKAFFFFIFTWFSQHNFEIIHKTINCSKAVIRCHVTLVMSAYFNSWNLKSIFGKWSNYCSINPRSTLLILP